MSKTITLEFETNGNASKLYSDVGPDGKDIVGRKRVALHAPAGQAPQTTAFLTDDPDFLAAPHGTPITAVFTLGTPPAPAAPATENPPAEHSQA